MIKWQRRYSLAFRYMNFIFAWSPVRKLMKDNGAEMVARDAVDALIDYLEKVAKSITNKALEMTRHASRKKLTLEDMNLAMKLK